MPALLRHIASVQYSSDLTKVNQRMVLCGWGRALRQAAVASMGHAYSMAAVQVAQRVGTPRFEAAFEAALEKMRDGVQAMAAWVHEARGEELGDDGHEG